jgi:hypothetical protein
VWLPGVQGCPNEVGLLPARLRSASAFAVTNANRSPVVFVPVLDERPDVAGQGSTNVGAVVPAAEGSLDGASRSVSDDLSQLGLLAWLALGRHQLGPVAPKDAAARLAGS